MSKRELLEDLIEQFEVQKFTRFLSAANSGFKPVAEDFDHYLDTEGYFSNFTKQGQIEFKDGGQLLVCTIFCNKPLTERTGKKKQYELAKKVLKDTSSEAGLFLFYDNNGRFRLSFICAQFMGTKRLFSTYRRYTYFVSPDLTNKTFKDQLTKCDFSSVDIILEAFSIEAVNKEFYTEIAKLFTKLTGGQRKIGSKVQKEKGCIALPGKQSDIIKKEFAVRLIGRLVFCWFLKKKTSKANIPLIPEELLSTKAMDEISGVGGYYHSILEPLFFELLNTPTDKRKNPFTKEPWSIIPFLNGGLFTPHEHDFYELNIDGISKYLNTLEIPPDWIKELLEIFERYNFTIDENTPIDVELSIEPEMLGRIFENLLAEINPETGETARKATGSYYTPRAIVEYMVNESLKQYLLTKTGIEEKKVTDLLSYSDEDVEILTNTESEKVIQALHEVKIIDPACGSGAFPIGILQKILLVLQKLDPDSKKWKAKLLSNIPNTTVRKSLAEKLKTETWQYIHKLGIIQNSIYGVDIQPIAAEISKLRIFLSLIVDETVNDKKDNRGIEPLPNLKYKLICGDSLIDKFMGRTIKITETVQTKSKIIIDRLTNLKADYFSAINEEEKVEYNLKILQNKIELAEQLLADLKDKNIFTDNLFGSALHTKRQKEQKEQFSVKKLQAELLNKAIENTKIDLEALRTKNKIDPTELENLETKHFLESFMWKLDFAEIFAENNGFDIVIGNPPYIEHKKLKSFNRTFKELFSCYSGTADIYVYFIEKAISILRRNGTLSFITSNKFIKTSYGEKIRGLLSKKNISKLIDFTDVHVFDALVASCVLVVNNCSDSHSVIVSFANDKIKQMPLDSFILKYHQKIDKKYFGSNIWLLEDNKKLRIKELIEKDSKPLKQINGVHIFRGVTTGYNPAFIIDDEKRKELITKDKNNAEIVKPLLQGRNIKKWYYINSFQNIIFTRQGIEIDDYPIIEDYLKLFYNVLKPRKKNEVKGRKPGSYKWYEIQDNTAYYNEFDKEKIIWGLTADKWAFAYDDKKHYLPSNGYILTSQEISIKYLLSILNSKLMEFYFGFEGIMTAGGAFTLKHETVREFPIKEIIYSEQEPFIRLVDEIFKVTQSDDYQKDENQRAKVRELEQQIDQMVYKLYGLTDDEIKIVENSVK